MCHNIIACITEENNKNNIYNFYVANLHDCGTHCDQMCLRHRYKKKVDI